ncbi:MAG: vitamin B12 dependent-methionine synthase activation domain-containing protein [Candidatus Omnitrophica bacterium]|nr:vitamin B12 dependent-methionine synthase activation domain-containing protein [Candidatus Omnitrophota bacterium]
MQEPEIFNQINLDLPLESIYKRLGYREGKTAISGQRQKETEKIINEALGFIELKGCALIEPVEKTGEAVRIGNFPITSKLLFSLLRNSDEILLCAATAGEKIIKEISGCSKSDLTRAIILDAVASEMADACFEWITSYYNRKLVRTGRRLTDRRISCGFSDFAIENQKKIYDLLKLNKIGIDITEQFILVPEKSATAVLGVIKL